MSKNKKKGEATIGKVELRQKLEKIFSNHPTQNYNYKQLATISTAMIMTIPVTSF